jgi:hypothetical protein
MGLWKLLHAAPGATMIRSCREVASVDTKLLVEWVMIAQVFAALLTLTVLWRKSLLKDFWALASLLGIYSLHGAVSVSVLFFRKELGISRFAAFHTLMITSWIGLFSQDVLVLLIIYGVFRVAMRPMAGLQRAGKIIFRWVASVSILLSVGLAFGPHLGTADNRIGIFLERLQQGTSVLMLCLLVFVCFCIKPLGLTFKSRIFGVSLGLGIASTCTLVEAAWLSTTGAQSVYSPVYLIGSFGLLACVGTWAVYFGMLEPERRLVLLPTTSPYFFWNKLSEALGDEPGHVVVAGFTPDMLAPGEVQMLKASAKASREQSRASQEQLVPEELVAAGR